MAGERCPRCGGPMRGSKRLVGRRAFDVDAAPNSEASVCVPCHRVVLDAYRAAKASGAVVAGYAKP